MNRIKFLMMKKYFFTAIMFVNCLSLSAQNSDWGLWTSLDAEKKLSKNWELGVTGQYRWKDNISVTDQIRGAVDISRKMGKYVKLSAGYELIAKYKTKKDIFVYRNRFRLNATGAYKYARFTASWRTRMQLTLLEKDDTQGAIFENDNYKWVWRNRFDLKYDIRKTPLKPYFNVELFHQLFGGSEPAYISNRISAGIEYKLSKHHTLEVGYKLENEIDARKKYRTNVVKLGYIFSF